MTNSHPLAFSAGRRSWLVLASLCGVLFAILLLYIFGIYPALVVGGHVLSEREFEKQYDAALVYMANARKVYGAASVASTSPDGIRQAILQGFVESSLVHDTAAAEVGAGNLPGIVSQKLANLGNVNALSPEIAAIYDMSAKDFESEVLVPQAEKDILTGRFFAEGKNYDDWLKGAESKARIYVFVPGFAWNGSGIEVTN